MASISTFRLILEVVHTSYYCFTNKKEDNNNNK
ncbi:hypothetical protein LCGC14_1987580, partial [marine sediment metagenome]